MEKPSVFTILLGKTNSIGKTNIVKPSDVNTKIDLTVTIFCDIIHIFLLFKQIAVIVYGFLFELQLIVILYSINGGLYENNNTRECY